MTKFEELCRMYINAEKNFSNYRWKCIGFAVVMGEGVADYLECNRGDIQYYLTSNLDQSQGMNQPKEAHPRDALLLESDTFWHYGMGVNLYREDNKNPAMTYIFDLALKGEENNFLVRFPKQQKEFKIKKDEPEQLQQIYEFIFDEIKDRFENELEKFLKHQSTEHYPGYM